MAFIPNIQVVKPKARTAEAKQNLHAIHLALERYAVDDPHGSYPLRLSQLRDEGYLPEFPRNPYKLGRGGGPIGPMHEVPLGEYAPGGVTYVPLTVDIYDEQLGAARMGVQGYSLLVYGDEKSRRSDPTPIPLPHGAESQAAWEYVLIVLDSGWNRPGRDTPE